MTWEEIEKLNLKNGDKLIITVYNRLVNTSINLHEVEVFKDSSGDIFLLSDTLSGSGFPQKKYLYSWVLHTNNRDRYGCSKEDYSCAILSIKKIYNNQLINLKI